MSMRDFSQDHRWLSINTATVRKQQGAEVPLARIIDQCFARVGSPDDQLRQAIRGHAAGGTVALDGARQQRV